VTQRIEVRPDRAETPPILRAASRRAAVTGFVAATVLARKRLVTS
jgi:hypothetical protein